MNYSTLKEAYSVDSFEKKNKNKKKIRFDDEDLPVDYPKTERIEKGSNTSDSLTDVARKEIYEIDDVPKNEYVKDAQETKPLIEPYYDEDLEKYLNIDEFKSSVPYSPDDQLSQEQPKKVINQKAPRLYQPDNNKDTTYNEKKTQESQSHGADVKDMFYKNLINIGLFILVGILIIFLCDQITEIAISIGMKKTVQILEPYLYKSTKTV